MKIIFAFFGILFFQEIASAQCYQVAQIVFNYDSLSSPTTLTLGDDQYSGKIAIGFPFCFYGALYDSIVVGANGVLTFDLSQAGGYCQWPIGAAIPTAMDPLNAIFFPWEDLQPTVGGIISYQTTGALPNRIFIVDFDSVSLYSSSCPGLYFTGQVKLYETTNVLEMNIAQKQICGPWNGGYAIEGIQNATGTEATVVPGRNYPVQWVATNDAWSFTPTCNVCSGVGIYELQQTDLSLFVSGENQVTIIPNGMDYKLLSVYDMLGQEVQFSQTGNMISSGEFTHGMFIINLEVNGNRVAKKVMMK